MLTSTARRVSAAPEIIFALAASVEDWPRILQHYRSVKVVSSSGSSERVVEMAARRQVAGPLAVPLWWRSIQRLDSAHGRIEFEHVAGITRGMRVAWTITAQDDGTTMVRIGHEFAPAWPVPDGLIQGIVGEYFVNGVARRTLHGLALIAEAAKMGR